MRKVIPCELSEHPVVEQRQAEIATESLLKIEKVLTKPIKWFSQHTRSVADSLKFIPPEPAGDLR